MPPSHHRARRVMLSLVALAVAPFAACFSDLEPDVGPRIAGQCDPSDSDSSRDVSFSRDLVPILTRAMPAAGCSCHQPSSPVRPGFELGGLDLSSYASLRRGGTNSGANIVVPNDPCASVIRMKISNAPPFGSRMPLSGPPHLTEAEEQLFHDWIAEGAHEN